LLLNRSDVSLNLLRIELGRKVLAGKQREDLLRHSLPHEWSVGADVDQGYHSKVEVNGLGMRGIVTPDKTWAGPDCVQTERFLKNPALGR